MTKAELIVLLDDVKPEEEIFIIIGAEAEEGDVHKIASAGDWEHRIGRVIRTEEL